MLPLKPFITLTRNNSGELYQRVFDVNSIYRFEAKYRESTIEEAREKNKNCTEVMYMKADSLEVVETPQEIQTKILEANSQALKRMQLASLSIR